MKDSAGIARMSFGQLNRIEFGSIDLGSYWAHPLGWGYFERKWWRNYLHVHDFYEICHVHSGKGTFRMLGRRYTVGSGDVFIAGPREEHEIISDRKRPLGIYFWQYTLLKNTETERSAAAEDQAITRLLDRFVESRQWIGQRVPGMLRTLELLTEEVTRAEPSCIESMRGLIRKLILDTARAVVEPGMVEKLPVKHHSSQMAMIEQLKRYMRDNCGRIRSIREIATQAHLSERHFTRIFRQMTGRTPLEWLTELRLDAAAQALLLPGKTIKAIAEESGYEEVRYFTTRFKRKFGLPPGAYRKSRGTRFKT